MWYSGTWNNKVLVRYKYVKPACSIWRRVNTAVPTPKPMLRMPVVMVRAHGFAVR